VSAAIYQKARPIHWDEVVGQEHVKDVLRPALERGRIGHAYLFSGPRGVGKTTTARLIAMTVNCDDSSAVKPCGVCESCKMVIAGRHPDVLEIDAASNNSVDDVRDLREKVALQPMRGTNKVYILDEAHMMSKSAFNALLKTLEEPPAHAVFVLATTEPERLPPTILSRCQHYRFRRLNLEEIAGKLESIASREGVNAQKEAIALIARSADGAMRDGESLLERMLASGEPVLTLAQVEGALGLPPQDRITNLAIGLAKGETALVLETLSALYGDGFAPRTITERSKIALRDIVHSILNVGPARDRKDNLYDDLRPAHLLQLIKILDEEDQRFARASDLISLEMAFTKALIGPASTGEPISAEGNLGVRVAALERQAKEGGTARPGRGGPPEFDPFARQPRPAATTKAAQEEAPTEDATDSGAATSGTPVPPRSEPQIFTVPYPANSSPANSGPASKPNSSPAVGSGQNGTAGGTWGDVVAKAKPQLKAFLREGKGEVHGNTVTLEYGPKHKWHAEQIAAKLEDVGTLVRQVCGEAFALELIMPDGTKKNSRGNNPEGAASVTRAAAPVPQATTSQATSPQATTSQAPSDAVVIEPRVEMPAPVIEPVKIEPARVEPAKIEPSIQARVEPRVAESRAETVQVLERPAVIAQPEISLEPESKSEPEPALEPEPVESAPAAPRVIPAFVQDGPIHIANALSQAMPAALEFDALGKPPSPEESLFGAKTYVQATEIEPAIEPVKNVIQRLEPPVEITPEPELQTTNAPDHDLPVEDSRAEDSRVNATADDDAPWLDSVEVALDESDVPFFEEGPPLELYDIAPGASRGSTPPVSSGPASSGPANTAQGHSARLQTPEVSKPRSAPRAPTQASTDDTGDTAATPEPKSPAKLRAHPNYDPLAKLLSHRVREAGIIEGTPKTVAETETVTAETPEETEA
jgi:DNA polymerase III subunit gamma/tau